MSLHLELAAMINDGFSSELQGPVECTQDAMIIRLANGVTLTVHYAAPDAYSMRWVHDGRIAGIDTAPLHRELQTFPNHLHRSNGKIAPDSVTNPDARPEDNMRGLIERLIRNPAFDMAEDV
ncbi:MAG TPA: DUF6516 family protein [Rhodocyclaceae bacterium]|jgi:hypothetical protein|nr:DUF6516 family protein [Rhodocyclaceae bacterium]HRQ47836.1 DUF6516 family protein [Rhodocyclaceae bacterium]